MNENITYPEDVFENQYYRYEIKNGIMTVQYKPGLRISLHDAHKIVSDRLERLGDLEYPVLVKTHKIKLLDKDAQKYLFSEGMVKFKAMAFMETNPLEKMLSNAFLTINKPVAPCRVFLKECEALDWLRKFL